MSQTIKRINMSPENYRTPSVDETFSGNPALVYLATGKAQVIRDGNPVALMSTGRFVGEMTCMTGQPATATVRVTQEARVLKLPASEFRRFVTRQPVVRDHIEIAFARDLRRKLSEHMQTNARRFDMKQFS